jgi:hypothetical protein
MIEFINQHLGWIIMGMVIWLLVITVVSHDRWNTKRRANMTDQEKFEEWRDRSIW